MTKIKELLSNREKLAKYDKLVEWKVNFEDKGGILAALIPADINSIIVSALEAEIKKLDEE